MRSNPAPQSFMSSLYEFFFEHKKAPYVVYCLAFVTSLAYAGLAHFRFGISEREAATQAAIVTVLVIVLAPILKILTARLGFNAWFPVALGSMEKLRLSMKQAQLAAKLRRAEEAMASAEAARLAAELEAHRVKLLCLAWWSASSLPNAAELEAHRVKLLTEILTEIIKRGMIVQVDKAAIESVKNLPEIQTDKILVVISTPQIDKELADLGAILGDEQFSKLIPEKAK